MIVAESFENPGHASAAGVFSGAILRPSAWARPAPRRRLGQRIKREIGALAAQPQVPKRPFGDSGRQFETIDQIRRGEHAVAGLTAKLLDARRGVDRVAEENDLLPFRAHLAGHHRTAMEPGSRSDGHAEFAAVIGRVSSQLVDGGETGPDAPAVSGPRPRASRSRSAHRRHTDGFRHAPRRSARVRSRTKRLTRRWKASGPSRSASPVEPSMSRNRNTRDSSRGAVVAAGDEVDEHVLPEQAVHVRMKANTNAAASENSTSGALNSPFSGRREHPLAELETEQDDDEIDAGLDRHMRGERRAAKRSSERPPQNEAIEGRENAGDDRAGQRAARQAIVGERVPAPLQDMHLGIGCAQRRCERGRPENVPVRAPAIAGRSSSCGRLGLSAAPQSNRHRRWRPPARTAAVAGTGALTPETGRARSPPPQRHSRGLRPVRP